MTVIRKVTPKEWKRHIEMTIQKQSIKKEKEKQQRLLKYTRLISIPILLGLISIILMIYLWGWFVFLEHFLSWIMGITIVTTIIAYALRINKKK